MIVAPWLWWCWVLDLYVHDHYYSNVTLAWLVDSFAWTGHWIWCDAFAIVATRLFQEHDAIVNAVLNVLPWGLWIYWHGCAAFNKAWISVTYLNVELLLCYASQNMGIFAKCCNVTMNDTCCILTDVKS